jgi:hypothetical protein
MAAVGALPLLEVLDLSYRVIEGAAHRRLCEALACLPRLRRLVLCRCGIGWGAAHGVNGGGDLAAALRHRPALQHADLYLNFLGDAGRAAVCGALERHPRLRSLHLGDMFAEPHAVSARRFPRLRAVAANLAGGALPPSDSFPALDTFM